MPEKKSPPKKNNYNNFLKNAKKSVNEEFLKGNFGKRIDRWKTDIITYCKSLKKIGNVAKNNYELGTYHYKSGNFDDAVFRFRLVTWLEPKNYNAWYWLGASYLKVDKKLFARNSLNKSLELKPGFQEAREMLKAAAETKVENSASG